MSRNKGIYKRGNVYWIRYAGLDGRIKFESTGSSSFKNAHDLLVKRRNEIMEGKEPVHVRKIGKYTFRELSAQYIEWSAKQKAFKSKKGFIKQLEADFGNAPLRSFNTLIVEKYQSKKLAINKPATVNRHLATLKHMFRKAVEWEMLEEETLKKVSRVKLTRENNRRLRYLSKEKCQELINVCHPHLKPIVITALNSGMRKGEILSLEWEKHVDLKHGFILLDITKNGERREIPINQTLRETLTKLVRYIDSPYVFTDDRKSVV